MNRNLSEPRVARVDLPVLIAAICSIGLLFLFFPLLAPSEDSLFDRSALAWAMAYFFSLAFFPVVSRGSAKSACLFVAVIGLLQFGQRLFVLSIRPDHLMPVVSPVTQGTVMEAVRYLTLATISAFSGILLGAKISGLIGAKSSAARASDDAQFYHSSKIRLYWILFSLVLLVLKLSTLFLFKRGFVGLGAAQIKYNWVMRPLNLVDLFLPFNIYLLLDEKLRLGRLERRCLWLFIWGIVADAVIASSRGALIALPFEYLCVSLILKRWSFRLKEASLAALLIMLTVLVHIPLANALRGAVRQYFFLNVEAANAVSGSVEQFMDESRRTLDNLYYASKWVSKLDVLVGEFSVGRDVLSEYLTLSNDVKGVANTLLPGEIFTPGPNPSELIPEKVRGIVFSQALPHQEHPTFFGMAYITMGQLWGCLYILLWGLILGFVTHRASNILIQVIFYQFFVFYHFNAGSINDTSSRFIESLFFYAAIFILYRIVSGRKPGAPPLGHEAARAVSAL